MTKLSIVIPIGTYVVFSYKKMCMSKIHIQTQTLLQVKQICDEGMLSKPRLFPLKGFMNLG
jgi:hypothetical protein